MKTSYPLNIIVVGLGHQSLDDHLPALRASKEFRIVGVHDTDHKKCKSVAEKYSVHGITDLDNYIEHNRCGIDVALVAVPHAFYLEIVQRLAGAKIDIIKEKPFATSFDEAVRLATVVRENNITLVMTLQRRFNPIFTSFLQLIKRIGTIHSIEARYVMNVDRLDQGWRASHIFAGGGALIDLGYHYIDLLVWYFGLPEWASCHLAFSGRPNQMYDVEDTAFLQFRYSNGDNDRTAILGNLIVSRIFPTKDEGLTAYGTDGHVTVKRGSVVRVYNNGANEERLDRVGTWPSALIDQLEHYADLIRSGTSRGVVSVDYLKHIAFIESAYESARNHAPENPQLYFGKIRQTLRGV